MCSRFLNVAGFAGSLFLISCQPQADRAAAVQPRGELVRGNRMTSLQPGKPVATPPAVNPLDATEDVIAEGKQLFNQFNCSGCHANGGGAIGPPLMDDDWIYGSSAGNIFWTIVEGRPQGMPAFGGRIAEHQVWRIVAYVRSLSGLHKQQSGGQGQAQAAPVK